MLTIVEPKDHYYYKSRLNLLMGLMNSYQDISLRPEEQARSTFILAEEEGNIYGGAILYKKDVSDLQDQIKNLALAHLPHREHIWVSTLFLCNSPSSEGFNPHKTFYKDLLESFVTFGKKEGIEFLCITLNSFEQLRTKTKELWPYILELKHQESLDGLCHGVLSLRETRDTSQSTLAKPSFQVA